MGGAINQMANSGGASGVGQALVDSSPILKALQNVGQGVGVAAQTPQMPAVGSAGVGTPGPVTSAAPATPDMPATTSQSQSGSFNPRDFTNYMVQQHGWSPTAAMGMAANIQDESGFNPNLYGDKGQSYGLAQWRNERKQALFNFAQSQGKSPSDWQTQADYLNQEMQGPYANAFKAMSAAPTPNAAAAIGVNQFEMPAEKYRVAREKNYLNADFSKYTPDGSAVASSSGGGMAPQGLAGNTAQPSPFGIPVAGQTTQTQPQSPQDKIMADLFGGSGSAAPMRSRGMPQAPQLQPGQPSQAVDTGAQDVANATQLALQKVAQSTLTPSTTRQASIQALKAQKAQV